CLLCTQARGPFLGLAVGGFFYFAIMGITRGKRWITYSVICAGISALLFLSLLNTSNWKFFKDLRNTPYVGRFGKLLGTEPTAKVRLLIWGGVMDAIGGPIPIELHGERDGPDRYHFIRPLVGYGPETMQTVFHRVHPPGLARYSSPNAVPDRSHNESLDVLVTTGALGLVLYLALVTSIVYYGLVLLNLVRSRKEKMAFLGLWIGCGAAGGIGVWFVGGRAFTALGLPFGLLLGLGSYTLLRALKSTSEAPKPKDAEADNSRWLIALLSALLAHFVEAHIGIATATTNTYFWLFAALIVAIGARMHTASWQWCDTGTRASPHRKERREKVLPAERGCIVGESILRSPLVANCGFIALLVLSTLIFALLHYHGDNSTKAFLWKPWIQPCGKMSAALLTLLIASWAVFTVVGLFETVSERFQSDGRISGRLRAAGIITLVSWGGAYLFTRFHTAEIASRLSSDLSDAADVLIPYVLLLSVSLMGFALHRVFISTASAEEQSMRTRRGNMGYGIPAAILAVGMAWSVWTLNIAPLRSDMIFRLGANFEKFGRLDRSIEAYEKAAYASKRTESYYTSLGRAYLQKAFKSAKPERNSWLMKSESALLHAREMGPLDPIHRINLGRLYYRWGQNSKDALKMERYRKAEAHFEAAHRLSPNREAILNEWGQYCLLMGDSGKAEALYRQSMGLDGQYQETHLRLGELYVEQKKWDEAGDAYGKAIEIEPDSITALKGSGYVAYQKGDVERALQCFEKAGEIDPEDYESRKNLALLYLQTGDRVRAVTQAEKAFMLAPKQERQAALDLLNSVRLR
ncbi:MAG: tetratricopeptide repeat protein, partial [Deltaproteobacteria bacterium]|nr:tetratricopeptide repeat protein [Deltaproteobacteria bacterium]